MISGARGPGGAGWFDHPITTTAGRRPAICLALKRSQANTLNCINMFGSTPKAAPTPPATNGTHPVSYGSAPNRLSSGVSIKGQVSFSSQLVIDCEVEGDITSDGKLTVARTGKLRGTSRSDPSLLRGRLRATFSPRIGARYVPVALCRATSRLLASPSTKRPASTAAPPFRRRLASVPTHTGGKAVSFPIRRRTSPCTPRSLSKSQPVVRNAASSAVKFPQSPGIGVADGDGPQRDALSNCDPLEDESS